MNIPLKHEVSPAAEDMYKRILRQKGEAEHIDKLVSAVCARLKGGLNSTFEMLGFEVLWTVDGKNENYDFRDLNDHLLYIMKTESDTFPAAISVSTGNLTKIVDMMLGADPTLQNDSQTAELTDLQQTIFEEFATICASTVETILQLPTRVSMARLPGNAIQSRIGEHATLTMKLVHGFHEYQFGMLISQNSILKLNFREKPPAPKEKKQGKLTPEKDVDIELTGIVYIDNFTLIDISNLGVGDTLSLKESKHCRTTITTAGRKLYKCQIGQDEASYALLLEAPHESMHSIITSAV